MKNIHGKDPSGRAVSKSRRSSKLVRHNGAGAKGPRRNGSAGYEETAGIGSPSAQIGGEQTPPGQEAAAQAGVANRRQQAFLNLPFHDSYESALLAFISALTCLGIRPRILTELSHSEARYLKLVELIAGCEYSLHEISYTGRDEYKDQEGRICYVPRFNMGFEAGIATCIATLVKAGRLPGHPGHQFYVFDQVEHRAQRSLSDLAGIDVHIHDGSAGGVARAVVNAFHQLSSEWTLDLALRVYERLKRRYDEDLKDKPSALSRIDPPPLARNDPGILN